MAEFDAATEAEEETDDDDLEDKSGGTDSKEKSAEQKAIV
jgi:hypothetical protein